MSGVGPGNALFEKSASIQAKQAFLACGVLVGSSRGDGRCRGRATQGARSVDILLALPEAAEPYKRTRAIICTQLLASRRAGLHERMARCRELAACDRASARKCDRKTARAPESRTCIGICKSESTQQHIPLAKQPQP